MWGICSTIINPLRALALPRTAKEQWVFGVHEPFLASSPISKPHFSSQRISVGLSLRDSRCPQVGVGNFTPTCLQAVKPKPAARCTCLCQWLAWPQVASLSFSLSCDFWFFNSNHFNSIMEKIQTFSCNFLLFPFLSWEFYGEVEKYDLETAWQEDGARGEELFGSTQSLGTVPQGRRDHPSRTWASAQNCWAQPRSYATHSWQARFWRRQSASILSPPPPARD